MRYAKRGKSKVKGGPKGAGACCDLICPTPGQNGVVVCGPNGIGVVTGIPATGGPWALAWNTATGAWVWSNQGG